MKKKLYVSLSVSFALTTAGFGAYKAYVPSDAAMSEQDLMVVENVLAITENGRYDIPWKALGEESCTIKKVNGDVAIVVNGVVIKPHASYEVEGTKKDCSFWPFAVCNPDAITLCHEIK